MTNYGDTETVFEESRNNTKYKGISPDAKTVTLELYVNKEEKHRTTYKKYETGIEDTYGEGEGRVYESDEDPLDLYSPVEGKIEIKIRWQKNNLIEEREEIPQLDIFTVEIKNNNKMFGGTFKIRINKNGKITFP